jgi:hypothetical protein
MQPRSGPALAGVQCLCIVTLLIVALAGAAADPARASLQLVNPSTSFTGEGGSSATQAGSHPDAWTLSFAISSSGETIEEPKDLEIGLPPGFVGMPNLVPRCLRSAFLVEACPASAAVGTAIVETQFATFEPPIYNLQGPPGVAAEIGMAVSQVPLAVDLRMSRQAPYHLIASLSSVSQAVPLLSLELEIWGEAEGAPFLTLPTRCGTQPFEFEIDSWQQPGNFARQTVLADDGGEPPQPLALGGCDKLTFAPKMTVRPSVRAAAAPSGVDVGVDVDQSGLVASDGRSPAAIRRAVVTLPEGMTVNPAFAEGLAACPPAGDCPDAAKIGTAEVETPLFDGSIEGALYVAKPEENPLGSRYAAYLDLDSPTLGLELRQPVKIEADADTGRLTITLDELPQFPISRFGLRLLPGPRAPFVTPPSCGSHRIGYRFEPWSGGLPLLGSESFAVEEGCDPVGFRPSLAAGSTNPRAGAATSFVVNVERRPGEENPAGISLVLPPGLSAGFGGVPLCPEDAASSGHCPDASRIGSVHLAVGPGSVPLRIPQPGRPDADVHLSGPRDGAPFGLAIDVPVRAGPFDLGDVVIRGSVAVDQRTGQARVHLDPLPRILDGIPVDYRSLRLILDRPGFVRNPTSCAATAVRGSATSVGGIVAPLADRFQVADCAALGFRPRASVRLLGSTRRGGHPQVRAVLRGRQGDANLRRVEIELPPTALLAIRNFRSVCPFDAAEQHGCGHPSRLGRVKLWTPLLDAPLEGPMFVRSSERRLPGLAVHLRGQVDIDLRGELDSSSGRLRVVFTSLPDLPVTKLVATIAGGKDGLLVNSGGVCASRHRTPVDLLAQSGKRHRAAPLLKTGCRAR